MCSRSTSTENMYALDPCYTERLRAYMLFKGYSPIQYIVYHQPLNNLQITIKSTDSCGFLTQNFVLSHLPCTEYRATNLELRPT